MPFQSHIGEIASLLVAVCWTLSALFFEKAGRKVGSLSVNIIRIFLAIIFLGITLLFTRGTFFPMDATSYNWFWLGLSGVVGFFIGDLLLFQSYVVIGSRTSQLVMSLAPMLTAVIGWFFLSEILSFKSIVGIIVSVSGIIIAIAGKKLKLNIPLKGFLYALGGALGQALGLILSKKGIGDYDPLAATQIRAIFGFFSFLILIIYMKRMKRVLFTLNDFQSMKAITIGTIFGPFIGVALSLFAIQHTQTGIASALMALTPIIIILPSAIMFKERVTTQQVIGAFISMAGAAIFFI
ncbi:MAG: DMT family transporter [Dysgonamonadaceae bacterium]|jgi:drug/metabolite transporter (DMT)-like permease|nr:DMT family transporter [Dysgonamonadaceae bacterium]MDD3355996.1 DMT family transporter [Dysgonamonadaceae bacterium]MDD4246875.1 DMT family transporter [Dysgonamonadaceae bacterium]